VYRSFQLISFICVCCLLSSTPVIPSESSSEMAAALIEEERVRSAVEDAFANMQRNENDPSVSNQNFHDSLEQVVAVGPAAAPYLIAELEQLRYDTFRFSAIALGWLGTPEAEVALRHAINLADETDGDNALGRKSIAVYSLALMGKADAVNLLNHGKHNIGSNAVHFDMSLIESVALMTAPESVPLLIKELDRYAIAADSADPATNDDMIWSREQISAIKALGRIADPASIPKLLEYLTFHDYAIRRQVAYALIHLGTPEAIAGLMAALDDTHFTVRFAAAVSLEDIAPAEQYQALVKRLEVEDDGSVRKVLYRVIARVGGESAIKVLQQYWYTTDHRERIGIIQAARLIRSERTFDLMSVALNDPSYNVVIQAVDGIAELGSERALARLSQEVSSPNWVSAQLSISKLVSLDVRAAAPAIAKRLINTEMKGDILDPLIRERVNMMSKALFALRYTDMLAEYRLASARQSDGQLKQTTAMTIRMLELLDKNGDTLALWAETANSDDPQLRLLAYTRLGKLGNKAAAGILVEQFGKVETAEGVDILRALGDIPHTKSEDLLERVLTGPAFDTFERRGLREMAGWSARRIGSERMYQALKASIERRNGQEARVMIYLALLGEVRAIPTLEAYRLPRMRYREWKRGKELAVIDRILLDLPRGRSIDDLDLPPEKLKFIKHQ
jgi:HEAT repeat protein